MVEKDMETGISKDSNKSALHSLCMNVTHKQQLSLTFVLNSNTKPLHTKNKR